MKVTVKRGDKETDRRGEARRAGATPRRRTKDEASRDAPAPPALGIVEPDADGGVGRRGACRRAARPTKAGIKAGDVIIAVAGKKVADQAQPSAPPWPTFKAGDKVKVTCHGATRSRCEVELTLAAGAGRRAAAARPTRAGRS